MDRYQVQFYTERNDGTKIFCICDFGREAETGKSPIVEDRLGRYRSFTSRENAQRVTDKMNKNEAAHL